MSSVQKDVGRQSKVTIAAIVIACVALVYVAITYFSNRSRQVSQISPVETSSQGTKTQESEHYAQVLDHYNREKADSAQQNGDTYLSVLSSRAKNVPNQPPPAAPAPQVQAQPAPVYYQPAAQNPQAEAQRSKEIAEQMQGLMSNWAPVAHGTARASADGTDYAKSINRVVDSGATEQAAAAAGNVKVVEDFALVPALLETDIDTDENSMVTADIPSGKYAGAKVYAMGYKRITNTVDMTFTFMSLHGRSYKITAKAVDQTSMRTALSGDVHNRYFSRIILPAIAMGIARTGQLYEQASEQNIITPQGGVIQTYPSTPSGRAVAGTILGGMGSQAGSVLANDASNMPVKQVLIPKGTTIGIQFVGPVLASADVSAGATGPTEQGTDALNALSQPASQPPRQNTPPLPPNGYGNYQQGSQPLSPVGYGYPRY